MKTRLILTTLALSALTASAALLLEPFPLTPPTGIEPYTWSNALYWTNGTAPTTLEVWQAFWGIRQDLTNIASEFAMVESNLPIQFTNTVSLASGSAPYCVNYGGMAGVFQLGVPAGAPGTNFVTANVFTNSVLSSCQIVVTNINPLTFSGSNYLGRVSQFYDFALTTPLLGGGDFATPTNETEAVWLSYSGTNAWFLAARRASIFTNVAVAVVGTSGNAGSLIIYGIDHPELVGRTNSYFGQANAFPTPLNPTDAANKAYVDASVSNALSAFLTSMDASNTLHVSLTRNLQTLIDITSGGLWVHIDGLVMDGTGSNMLMSVAQSGLQAGWSLQSSTNLAMINGWATFTGYTATTNSGEVTFTIPFSPNAPAQFFRAALPARNAMAINAPMTIGGALQLYAQTNTPTIGDLGNQRGGRIWISNGVFYATGSTNGSTTYTKQLAP